jgi:hypothetical protein
MLITDVESLDEEWVALMREAKASGLTINTVYEFLHNHKNPGSFALQGTNENFVRNNKFETIDEPLE